jgi:hypothetical protein
MIRGAMRYASAQIENIAQLRCQKPSSGAGREPKIAAA